VKKDLLHAWKVVKYISSITVPYRKFKILREYFALLGAAVFSAARHLRFNGIEIAWWQF
jgi:hypothetical protein